MFNHNNRLYRQKITVYLEIRINEEQITLFQNFKKFIIKKYIFYLKKSVV